MRPLLVVVLIVLIDLLGFSLVIPLLPRYGDTFGFNETQIGLLQAAFPLCQLVAGPILGRLSDRYGRRPVLIVSQMGTAISFVLLAFSHSFVPMLLARMLDGASGGNILVAQAYVADITKPEDRAKSLGLIGAAFGVGFTMGPLLGGLLLSAPVSPEWQLRLPFLMAAVCATVAWVLVLTRLPESVKPGGATKKANTISWRGITDVLKLPMIGRLVLLGATTVLAFAALEGTFSLYLARKMGWGARTASYWFALFGLISIVVQGGLIGRLVPRFGEARLARVGLAWMIGGFAAIAWADGPALLALGSVLVGVGYSLAQPTISGLLSRSTPALEQGAVFGVMSSAQTLARSINYLVATPMLGWAGPSAPYWEATALASVALLMAFGLGNRRGVE